MDRGGAAFALAGRRLRNHEGNAVVWNVRFRVLIVVALLAGVAILTFEAGRRSRAGSAPNASAPVSKAPTFRSSFKRPLAGAITQAGAENTNNIALTLWQRVESNEFQLTPEQLAAYLRHYGTNVETLLATQDRGYLKLAAELFPNDPRVQYAVVSRDLFPEARREWLDRFKQSAPDNAMANYLSARDYLKAGDRDAALKDLSEAMRKPHFNDYTLEQVQNMEDAQLSAGRTIAEAKVAAGSGLLLPQLAMFKEMSQSMQAWQKEYVAAGDTASAQALAQMGHNLAQQLMTGEGSRPLINQLVGAAIDRIVLSPLPPDSQADFLGTTVQEHIDDLTAFRQGVRSLTQGFNDWMSSASEADLISYFDRLKLQGEYQALQWLRNRQALQGGM